MALSVSTVSTLRALSVQINAACALLDLDDAKQLSLAANLYNCAARLNRLRPDKEQQLPLVDEKPAPASKVATKETAR